MKIISVILLLLITCTLFFSCKKTETFDQEPVWSTQMNLSYESANGVPLAFNPESISNTFQNCNQCVPIIYRTSSSFDSNNPNMYKLALFPGAPKECFLYINANDLNVSTYNFTFSDLTGTQTTGYLSNSLLNSPVLFTGNKALCFVNINITKKYTLKLKDGQTTSYKTFFDGNYTAKLTGGFVGVVSAVPLYLNLNGSFTAVELRY